MKDVPLVLVADDEPTMREMVAHHLRTLTSPKLEVIEAGDGEEALRVARERLPDLVVLDVVMPEMSGWEVCKKIREDVSLAHTGIVMLTGIGHRVNELTSPLWADAYIDKPFEFGELDTKVKEALAARAKFRQGVPRAGDSSNGVAGLAKAHPRSKKKKSSAKKKSAAKKKSTKRTAAKKPTKRAAAKKKTSPKKKKSAKKR